MVFASEISSHLFFANISKVEKQESAPTTRALIQQNINAPTQEIIRHLIAHLRSFVKHLYHIRMGICLST